MERRSFLGCGALAGVGALAGLPDSEAASAPVDVPAFELDEVSVAELQQQMARGERSAEQIAQAYLDRIAALDRRGPALHSVIETNPEALAIARALDGERKAKGARGPLHGIPVLVKDNVDTADKMTTTAGSLALEGVGRRGATRTWPRGCAQAGRRDPRQGEPVRVGELPLVALDLGLERARRPVPQPLRARPQPLRVELGLGRRRLGQPGAARGGHGDRRLDRVPGHELRHRRHQAHGRAREPRRHHPDLAHAGHGGPDGAHRGRRGGAPGRARRRGRARSRDARPGAARRPTTRAPSIPTACAARASASPATWPASIPTPTACSMMRSQT